MGPFGAKVHPPAPCGEMRSPSKQRQKRPFGACGLIGSVVVGMFMLVKQETVVMYRDLAKRWDERAVRASSQNGRERCEQLADAYRSLVSVLVREPLPPTGDGAAL